MANSLSSQQSSRTSTSAFSQQSTVVGGRQSSTSNAGVALTRAVNQFRARLSGNDLVDFKTTTYEQLCQEIIHVQKEQERRLDTRNLARIKTCLEAMHQFSKVIEVFLNVSNMVAFVWGPMKFLLLVI